jgi:hypothetical protein
MPSLWLLHKGIGFLSSEGRAVDEEVRHYNPQGFPEIASVMRLCGTGMQTNGRCSRHIQ